VSAARKDPAVVLRRLLANGPLTGLPARPEDQALLLRLAVARLDASRELREPEVNDALRAWLATFVAPFGIDHVTLRRMLVDARLLRRDRAGSTYAVDAAAADECAALAALDPAAILDEARREREARKRAHGAPGSGPS